MKRTLVVFLMAVVFAICPLILMSDTYYDGAYMWTYTVSNGRASLYNGSACVISPKPIGELVIPSSLGGYPVTSIGYHAFYCCSELTAVTIPMGVTVIGGAAFNSCTRLTTVQIPSSMMCIGSYAFAGCSELVTVKIPSSVTSIEEYAFSGCSSLAEVTIPHGITNIEVGVFSICSSLVSVTIPSNIVSIGAYAFSKCSRLTSVTIPSSVTSIGASAFASCEELKSLTIPDSVTNIGGSAFAGTGLTSIVIPSSVTIISGDMFSRCSSLASVTIPSTVTSIGGSAFSSCSELTSVMLPSNLTSIGGYAFYVSGLTSLIIPSRVTTIDHYAFSYCRKLTSVTIPPSVKSIGADAFAGCGELKLVYVFKGDSDRIKGLIAASGFNVSTVTFIEQPWEDGSYTDVDGGYVWAFDLSSGEATIVRSSGHAAASPEPSGVVVIPSALKGFPVTGIGGGALRSCSKMTSVTIPTSIENIGAKAFSWCNGLTEVIIHEGVTNVGGTAFYECGGLRSVTIPRSVTRIGEAAFQGCSYLSKVIMSDGVMDIGRNAFCHCYGLSEISIPPSVTNIGDMAFNDCRGLMSIEIPEKVITIGSLAFDGCNRMTNVSVDVNNRIYSSEDGVLYNKCKTTLIKCPNGKSGSLMIPASVTNIGNSVLSGCVDLAVLSVDENNMMYSTMDGVLYDKAKTRLLKCPEGKDGRVLISSTVTNIGLLAFQNCSKITTLMIPSTVVTIGSGAFTGCSGLNSVYVSQGDVDRIKRLLSASGCNVSKMTFIEWPLNDGVYTQSEDGYIWTFVITGGKVKIYNKDSCAVSPSPIGTLKIPSELGGRPVTEIGDYAFCNCKGLSVIKIPTGVISIGNGAFEGCGALAEVSMPESIRHIYARAFANCECLESVVVPPQVLSIGSLAFAGCSMLMAVEMKGDAPEIGDSIFDGTPKRLIVSVPDGTIDWDEELTTTLPSAWAGRKIIYSGETYDWKTGASELKPSVMTLIVTNTSVCYIFNSVQPEFALPVTADRGFVNIIAEVKGGVVSVPESWTVNYPKFTEKFGSDFTKSLAMKTGKKDGAGNDMFVWQDYVAGTDPTKEDDVFTASITIVDGKVKVSYTPELDDARKALRKYTTWGKAKLTDKDWSVVGEGEEGNFNFFRVTVEMK